MIPAVLRKTTIGQLITLDAASKRDICKRDVAHIYLAPQITLSELAEKGLLTVSKRKKENTTRDVLYYRTTTDGDRLLIAAEKLLTVLNEDE